MRKVNQLLTLGLMIFSVSAKAQAITFDSTNAPALGTIWHKKVDSTAKLLAVTAGGTNITWNYDSAFNVTDSVTDRFESVTKTGLGSVFPKAKLAMIDSNKSIVVNFVHSTGKGLFSDGDFKKVSGINDTLIYMPAKMLIPFGVTYKDSVASIGKDVNRYSSSGYTSINKVYTHNRFKVDGYGTVKTPAGTFKNVLRIKLSWLVVDSALIDSAKKIIYSSVTEDKGYSYIWVQNNSQNPIVMAIYLDSNYVVLNGYYCYGTGTATEEANKARRAEIYPNPANNTLMVRPETLYACYDIELLNILGQRVLKKSRLSGSTVLPMSGLANGAYVCLLTQNGVSTVKHLVISH